MHCYKGLGGEICALLVNLAIVSLNLESAAADPAILPFFVLTRQLRGVPGKNAILRHKVAFLIG